MSTNNKFGKCVICINCGVNRRKCLYCPKFTMECGNCYNDEIKTSVCDWCF